VEEEKKYVESRKKYVKGGEIGKITYSLGKYRKVHLIGME